jgi:Zn-dependent peptidase ImmA (M78 family)/DNA-binding XRE family transcriptional regulator
MFTPSRLSLARRRRGFTKVRLARAAGLTVKSITDYESERTEPLPETMEKLAEALGFPVAFFQAPDVPEIAPEATTFRALSKLTAAKRDQALSAASLALDFHRWISERFRLPALNMPDHLAGEDPERAAEILRAEWQLGEKPIPNMIRLLEAHGVRVFSLAEDYAEVDAFAAWDNGTPFVFLNTFKSSERSRMDAAHELGHLILHRHGTTTRSRSIEEEAKRFASAFLMPRSGLLPTAPTFPSMEQLIHVKRRWKVSVAALAFRLHELGAISDWHYRSICIDIARLGYRRKEPNEIERETSEVVRKVMLALRDEGTNVVDVARALHLPVHELSAFISGFATLPVHGGGQAHGDHATVTTKPRLTVVNGGNAEGSR